LIPPGTPELPPGMLPLKPSSRHVLIFTLSSHDVAFDAWNWYNAGERPLNQTVCASGAAAVGVCICFAYHAIATGREKGRGVGGGGAQTKLGCGCGTEAHRVSVLGGV
jgi:hypothetical protein